MDTDLPLIEALQAGDDSALSELMARYGEGLFHFAFRYVHNEWTAREVVQETFVRVYFKTKKFEPRSSVKTWLYAIALNLCRDQHRRLSKQRREIPLTAQDAGEESPLEPVDPQPLPGECAVQKDRFEALQRAIDQLPHPLRAALILFSLEGRSQREAAEILGTTPKTVETRVYHAKDKLRKLLGSLE